MCCTFPTQEVTGEITQCLHDEIHCTAHRPTRPRTTPVFIGGHTETIKVQLVLIVERLMSTPAATQSKSELVCVQTKLFKNFEAKIKIKWRV